VRREAANLLPFTVGIRDGAVQMVSTLGSVASESGRDALGIGADLEARPRVDEEAAAVGHGQLRRQRAGEERRRHHVLGVAAQPRPRPADDSHRLRRRRYVIAVVRGTQRTHSQA
jgi:hypothetical protein